MPVGNRYVALGSSMAAGPGIKPKAAGAPMGSGRSAVNYPHLVAARLSYDLVDVTFSGATTASVLSERQRGAPPQVEALDGTESLVTITIGGNDAGYVPCSTPRAYRAGPDLFRFWAGSCAVNSTATRATPRWPRSGTR